MTNTVRVALIGYGLGGRSFHAPLIAAVPALRLDFIVTASAERVAQARAEFPDATVLGDAAALWARRDDVDLVVISTPNRTHVPLATAAMELGLAVVVDKPVAATAAEARQLAELSRRRGVPLSIYQNRRWDGDFRTLRRLVGDRALGSIHKFESRFERWRPVPKHGWRESAAPEDAGGLLYDIGPHLIDQALVLLGPVTQVYAEVRTLREGMDVDDDVFLALTHASGAQSHLWTSLLAAEPAYRFRLLGTGGVYTRYGMDPQEEALRSGQRPGAPGWGEDPRERWGILHDGTSARPVPTDAGAYQGFYEEMARAVAAGAPVPVHPDDAVQTMRVIEAAQRSARESRVVSLAHPGDDRGR